MTAPITAANRAAEARARAIELGARLRALREAALP